MAQRHVPLYKEQGKTQHADTCDPLIEAVNQGELELAALGRATYPGERIPDQIRLESAVEKLKESAGVLTTESKEEKRRESVPGGRCKMGC